LSTLRRKNATSLQLEHFGDRRWVEKSAPNFGRRVFLPALTAALTPAFGGRSLEIAVRRGAGIWRRVARSSRNPAAEPRAAAAPALLAESA
jgi:hypothetical protein